MSNLNFTRKTLDDQATEIEQESIHTCAKIQPHGLLFVLEEPSLKILQVSQNTYTLLGIKAQNLLGQTLETILDPFQLERLESALQEENFEYLNPQKIWIRKQGDDYAVFDSIFHRNPDGVLILELEPAFSPETIPFLSFYHLAQVSIGRLQAGANLRDFCEIIVQEVQKITGFDRVMLYKFDEDQHGEVIAEEKVPELEPYLGLHFPESDIPKVARQLFSSNWIRLIPNTQVQPVPIVPENEPECDRPLNLTNSILRSASPCHIEYLHNMEVGASLTISLIKEGTLWGIIACHHRTPKYVSYELRKACEFLGRVIFSEISAREETEDYDYNIKLGYIQSMLIDFMSQEHNFVDGLTQYQPNLLDLVNAQGAAICFGDKYTLVGQTPSEEDIKFLLQWLKLTLEDEIYYTDSLPLIYPDAERFKKVGSGLLAISISKNNYVLWFRPEVIQTVHWGGNPNQAYTTHRSEGELRLSPRKSFELWKETVKLTALPWKTVEIRGALELRKAIINVILRQAEELAQLAQDLERSNAELKKFAYVASHDLQEPLNQVANYVQLLEMRYREALDQDAEEFIGFVVEGVSLMQTLIDDVLAYSKVDMRAIKFTLTDVSVPLDKALSALRGRIAQTDALITYDAMPTVMADSTQLMQLFQNLIGNGIKFRGEEPPVIHIGAKRLEDAWLFSVTDNGIGLDLQFSDRIFVIFQRLHTRDEYQGTGMGLAICKKIVECHRGRIWVESEVGQGATFYFTIPVGRSDRAWKRNYQGQR